VARTLLSDLSDGSLDPATITRIANFLRTRDAETVARQVLVSELAGHNLAYETDLRLQIRALLILHAQVPEQISERAAESVYKAILEGCALIIAAVERHPEEAARLRSSAWGELITSHLESISRTNTFFSRRTPSELAQFLEFEAMYRQQVNARYETITPPNFDNRRRIPIDDIYVLPRFSKLETEEGPSQQLVRTKESSKNEPSSHVISFPELRERLHRTVVLGDPGAGKTTFAAKLAHDFSGSQTGPEGLQAPLTPIVVVLRDYGAQKRQDPLSIVDFIELNANSSLQVSPPNGAIEYLLLSGRAIVIFDGLDELLDTHFRQEITSDLESFGNRYPQVPILVTSRRVGYDQAPLDPRVFSSYALAQLDESAVGEYAEKWFTLELDDGSQRHNAVAKSFLQESSEIEDLRSNPLMLGLLCNIYRGDGYIPKNRPEVYEKCSVLLFQRWDASRGIRVYLPFQAHIEPAIKYLAFWIYSDEGLQSGVTERRLIQKSTEYLLMRRYEDRAEAEAAAAAFVEYCRGRAWVFTDTGSTMTGEPLYQFTHRTFLEYFAASHIVRVSSHPGDLWKRLEPYISSQEWDMVAQLAVQILSLNLEHGADDFLTDLLESASGGPATRRQNLLRFAARSLEILVPAPSVIREVVGTCVSFFVETGKLEDYAGRPKTLTSAGALPIIDLFNVTQENLFLATDAFESTCMELALTSRGTKPVIAMLLAGILEDLAEFSDQFIASERIEHWSGVSARLIREFRTKVKRLARSNVSLALCAYEHGEVGVQDIIRWHGLGALFLETNAFHVGNVASARDGLAHRLAWRLFTGSYEAEHLDHNLGEQVASSLRKHSPPYFDPDSINDISLLTTQHVSNGYRPMRPLPDDFFAGAVLTGVIVERILGTRSVQTVIRDHKGGLPPDLNLGLIDDMGSLEDWKPALLARMGQGDPKLAVSLIQRHGLRPKDVALLSNWIRGEVDFLAPSTNTSSR
jgi:hypothetical protein